MQLRNSTERYGLLAISLHWLVLLLVIGAYACIELREMFPKGSDPREALKTWHYTLGLSVLALATLRLLVNVTGPTPRIAPEPAHWQQMAARLMHIALYGLMIGMPLAGWLILSAEGKPIVFFGLSLPALVAESKSFAKGVKEVHEFVGNVGYGLIGLHAAAALYHHYIVRDNTLRRMLPGQNRAAEKN